MQSITSGRHLVLAVAVVVLLGACSGDDGGAPAQGEDASITVTDPPASAPPTVADDSTGGSISGEGTGTVTVDGVTYTVDVDLCIVQGEDLFVDGPATGSDGTTAWVSVNHSFSARESMADVLDDEELEQMFAGANYLEAVVVEVRVGSTRRYDWDSSQPSWIAEGGDADVTTGTLTYAFDGRTITGSGEAEDTDSVALEAGETAPIEFEVGCD